MRNFGFKMAAIALLMMLVSCDEDDRAGLTHTEYDHTYIYANETDKAVYIVSYSEQLKDGILTETKATRTVPSGESYAEREIFLVPDNVFWSTYQEPEYILKGDNMIAHSKKTEIVFGDGKSLVFEQKGELSDVAGVYALDKAYEEAVIKDEEGTVKKEFRYIINSSLYELAQ